MHARELDKLLIKIQKGDNAAFEELYVQTKRGVYAFLYTYFRNPADVEDGMQATYLRVKTGIGGYTPGTNGRAWILQIAKNYALNELRKSKREISADDVEIPYEQTFNDGSVTELMKRILTEEEQRIVTLHVLWKYKHREIAEILDIPTGTVTSKYKRAIEKLKKNLKEEEV